MSLFLLSAYQTPNVYVDLILSLVTDAEWKVLTYAMRRTYGFNQTTDRISLSQFATGIKTQSGRQIDRGTGLSIPTVRACLAELVTYGLIRKVPGQDSNAETGEAQGWEVNPDESTIDLAGLEARAAARSAARTKRTSAGEDMAEGIAKGIVPGAAVPTPEPAAMVDDEPTSPHTAVEPSTAGGMQPPSMTDLVDPQPAKTRRSTQAKTVAARAAHMDHQAVAAYRDLAKRTPNEVTRSLIVASVTPSPTPEDPAGVAAWRTAVQDCLASGCNPGNVKFMLTVYTAGGYDAWRASQRKQVQQDRDRVRSAASSAKIEAMRDTTEVHRERMERFDRPAAVTRPRRPAPRVDGLVQPGVGLPFLGTDDLDA